MLVAVSCPTNWPRGLYFSSSSYLEILQANTGVNLPFHHCWDLPQGWSPGTPCIASEISLLSELLFTPYLHSVCCSQKFWFHKWWRLSDYFGIVERSLLHLRSKIECIQELRRLSQEFSIVCSVVGATCADICALSIKRSRLLQSSETLKPRRKSVILKMSISGSVCFLEHFANSWKIGVWSWKRNTNWKLKLIWNLFTLFKKAASCFCVGLYYGLMTILCKKYYLGALI